MFVTGRSQKIKCTLPYNTKHYIHMYDYYVEGGHSIHCPFMGMIIYHFTYASIQPNYYKLFFFHQIQL